MPDQDIIDRIHSILAREFEADVSELGPGTRLIEDVGLDSLDSVDLIAAMEREFGVKVPETRARQLLTLGDIYTYVDEVAKDTPV